MTFRKFQQRTFLFICLISIDSWCYHFSLKIFLCLMFVSETQCSEAFFFQNRKKTFSVRPENLPPLRFLSQILELIHIYTIYNSLITKFQNKNVFLQFRYWDNRIDIFGFFHSLTCILRFFQEFFEILEILCIQNYRRT